MTEQPPVVPSVGAVPVEVPEEALRAGACALANVVRLPDWLQVRALGHDMRPLAQLALAAAYPLIAAQVGAEAFTERAAIVEVLSEFAPLALPNNDLPTIVRGVALQRDNQHELKDHLAEVARRLTDERDRVRAEERRRVGAAIEGERRSTADADEYSRGYQQAIDNCLRVVAAGSAVPVATPEPTVEIGGQKMTQAQFDAARFPLLNPPPCSSCRRPKSGEEPPGSDLCWPCLRVERHHGYVAGVEPVDEVECPNCGHMIRARMSDRSTPERGAALEDLEHALTLALQAMAENDCCADEDDPDWRGPAIEQFRQDLRALGVRDAEMDAVGIKAPAEQDGQR